MVAGIAGYGNCMGIPTVGGEVYFDESYNGNPLVNAFALGITTRNKIFKGRADGPGNPVIYLGAKTGKDGVKGAIMASDIFEDDKNKIYGFQFHPESFLTINGNLLIKKILSA